MPDPTGVTRSSRRQDTDTRQPDMEDTRPKAGTTSSSRNRNMAWEQPVPLHWVWVVDCWVDF